MHDWMRWLRVVDGALILVNGALLLYLRRLDRRLCEFRRCTDAIDPPRP